MDGERRMLRHAVATLAYRAAKAVRGCAAVFGEYRASETTRTPSEIVSHVADVLDWGISAAEGRETWVQSDVLPWEAAVQRLFASLERFDALLGSDAELHAPADRLLQGPVADALTHVGQLAMLRRMAGAPVRPENYYVADVEPGRVGPDQKPPRFEF